MTEEERLIQENSELRERVRVAEHLAIQLQSQVQELRSANTPTTTQKSRWFGWKEDRRKGAFDMLEVATWDGSQLRLEGPWNYTVRLRYSGTTIVLGEEQFKEFALAFDAYLGRT